MNGNFIKENAAIGEKYYYTKHKSGLDIYLIPKKTTSAYAVFCTRFGSVDNRFRLEGEKDFTSVPDGVAHYLEHKMFENADGEDTLKKFARYGASANAFTSTDITAYLFRCAENFTENLRVLLECVTTPYFTEENVERERGIIGQEICGRDDNPDFIMYMNLLSALYRDSQIKIDVAGSVESISKITCDTLYKCYNAFYDLSNMILCVAGDVLMEDITAVADKVLSPCQSKNIIRSYAKEPREIVKRRVYSEFEISKPMFLVGVKDSSFPGDALERARRAVVMNFVTEALFGDSSEFAVEVYETGLIDALEAGYSISAVNAMYLFGGESAEPEKAYEKFVSYIENTKKHGISPEEFERARRVKYAEYVRSFESVDVIAETFAMAKIKDYDWFDMGNIMSDITLDEANALLCEIFDEKYYAMSVVDPIKRK
ncbi:MAG: EF-P 5-aminopentanol modification-associated protein YfmH [Eubacteriales bacterium]